MKWEISSFAAIAFPRCLYEKERIMNVRKMLLSHKEIDDRIDLGLEEIAQLRSLAERVTVRQSLGGSGPRGGYSDRVGTYAAKIADLERSIDRDIDRLVDLKETIIKMVASLGNDTERLIIERRYILHQNMEEIAEKLGYTPRHIARLHKNALEKLEEMYEEKIA